MSSGLFEEMFAELLESSVEPFGLNDIPWHDGELIIVQYGDKILSLFSANNFVEL